MPASIKRIRESRNMKSTARDKGLTESAWQCRRLQSLEVRMEHRIDTFVSEALPA